MEKQQLYARGKPFSPETNAEDISALDIYGITGHQENTLQALLDRIADQVANRLIKKTEIAEWAKQEEKPPGTGGSKSICRHYTPAGCRVYGRRNSRAYKRRPRNA